MGGGHCARGAAAAFYYRTFIIEDLVPQAPEQESQSVVVGTHAGPVWREPRATRPINVACGLLP